MQLMFKFLLFTLLAAPLVAQNSALREYTIVIDPGHGGVPQKPYQLYGDKYDPVRGEYIESFKEGAVYKKKTERRIVLALSREIKKILDLTATEKGFNRFREYIRYFSDGEYPRIHIKSHLSRTDDYRDNLFRARDDKNAKYRLYDFPDIKTGKMMPGRISRINSLRPHMVVSLHLNPSYKTHPGGMAAVLTPGYETFDLLRNITLGKASRETFLKTPWSNWMIFRDRWSPLQTAWADAWIYFNGYWSDKSGKKTVMDDFEGYRQNMISWKYREDDWLDKRKAGKGAYALDHNQFVAQGPFWDRERGKAEKWRREGGLEGYGGDNHYAANEIMKFVQYGVRKMMPLEEGKYRKMGPINPPYISTYSMPTFVNAISAYLEIGYIDKKQDMFYIEKKRKLVAASIAVGIYSLIHGIELKNDNDMPYIPKGRQIDFGRYENLPEGNYFRIVAD